MKFAHRTGHGGLILPFPSVEPFTLVRDIAVPPEASHATNADDRFDWLIQIARRPGKEYLLEKAASSGVSVSSHENQALSRCR